MNKRAMILVVDDDENDVRMTLAALARHGVEAQVCVADDGAEALDYLHCRGKFKDRPPGNPGLLLLDLNMPRIDGWGVLRELKADAHFRTIPVVVFTSSARDHDVAQCYELGANAFVVKPIAFDQFSETVRDIRAFWIGRNHPPPNLMTGAGLAGRMA